MDWRGCCSFRYFIWQDKSLRKKMLLDHRKNGLAAFFLFLRGQRAKVYACARLGGIKRRWRLATTAVERRCRDNLRNWQSMCLVVGLRFHSKFYENRCMLHGWQNLVHQILGAQAQAGGVDAGMAADIRFF